MANYYRLVKNEIDKCRNCKEECDTAVSYVRGLKKTNIPLCSKCSDKLREAALIKRRISTFWQK